MLPCYFLYPQPLLFQTIPAYNLFWTYDRLFRPEVAFNPKKVSLPRNDFDLRPELDIAKEVSPDTEVSFLEMQPRMLEIVSVRPSGIPSKIIRSTRIAVFEVEGSLSDIIKNDTVTMK